MRCYTRQRDPRTGRWESEAAFAAFAHYRDAGPTRSLAKTARVLYGDKWRSGKRTLEGWSARWSWSERVRERDDFIEGIKQKALADAELERAADHEARRTALADKLLSIEEQAAEETLRLVRTISKSPHVRQRVTRRDDDGRPVEYVVESVVGPLDLAAQRLYKVARGVDARPDELDAMVGTASGRDDRDVEAEFDELVASEVNALLGDGEEG